MPGQIHDSGLWSDEPTNVDLLAFTAVAATVNRAVLDEALDPVAVGVSGAWGSGKTTVLRLIEKGLRERNLGPEKQLLVISTDPWRYDPAVGAKESLIAEILAAITTELENKKTETDSGRALDLAKKLAARVQWTQAIKLAATTALTMQIPSLDKLTDLIVEPSGKDKGAPRGLSQFRAEFENLMASKDLAHLERVVVLVDDLDRCLPGTVIETLEAMRLFLAVPKMAFVIAADEDRVADAIRDRFPAPSRTPEADNGLSPEEPASLYLHKIVQTTVPIPALSRFDTEAYLILLQLSHQLEHADFDAYVRHCDERRSKGELLDDLASVAKDRDIAGEMAFAARLTPILYEKLRGNPRRIKRFLNDLRVRQSVAEQRGIVLHEDVVAKLMVLEKLIDGGFTTVLDWLAKGELRTQVRTLEKAAGRVGEEPSAPPAKGETTPAGDDVASSPPKVPSVAEFTDDLLRWAKLPPALSSLDLAPYLYLAASFTGKPLFDTGLPSRLRDLASNLLSRSTIERKSVADADIQALNSGDATILIEHFARVARDQPAGQATAVKALLRIIGLHPALTPKAETALLAVPAEDLVPSTVMSLQSKAAQFATLLQRWKTNAVAAPVKRALGIVIGGQG